ncbi:MAG: DUF2470 domain-containing protein [Bacteroidota bacterium]
MDYAINHVNEDHRKEMVQIVKGYTDVSDVSDVTLLDYDAKGMEAMVVEKNKGKQKIWIGFPRVLKGPHDFRSVLVDMVNVARKKLEK